MTKVVAIKVAETASGTLHFVVNPKDSEKDGLIVDKELGTRFVPFWSYVWRTPVVPITSTNFHKGLWSNQDSDEWEAKYVYRSKGIDLLELREADKFMTSFNTQD